MSKFLRASKLDLSHQLFVLKFWEVGLENEMFKN